MAYFEEKHSQKGKSRSNLEQTHTYHDSDNEMQHTSMSMKYNEGSQSYSTTKNEIFK